MADSLRYDSPEVLALTSAAEQRNGLPAGLLTALITRGERSNSDQVSEAGARGLGQIIPATRKAAITQFGIDPYLSDENSVDVAAKLLKQNLDANKGDVARAVATYHGGTDESNWGTRTKAYVKRVTGALPADASAAPAAADPGAAPSADGPSTFEKLWGAANAPQPHQVASILQAYQSGQMAPEDKRQFEADVKSGKLMLPQGASLMPDGMVARGNINMDTRPRVRNADGSISTVRSIGINDNGQEVVIPTVSDDGRIMSNDEAIQQYRQTGRHLGKFSSPEASDAFAQSLHESEAAKLEAGKPAGAALPAGVVEAYRMGKITGADRDQLLADVKAGTVTAPAGSALDLEARFPDRDYKSARIPGVAGVQRDEQGRPYVGAATAAPPTIGDQIVGAGEAALAGVTGATTGFTGAIGATIGNMAAQVHSGLTGDGVSPNDPRVLAVTGGQASRDGDPDLLQAQNEAGAGLTYAPRTDAGQHQAAALGDAMAPLVGLAPAEAGALHSGATPIVQAVRGAARATPAAVADVVGAVKSGAGAVADAAGAAVDRVRGNAPAAKPTPGTMGSAGAAGTDVAAQRVALGQQMDVPIELTKGQATRDFEQQRFERETQKDPSTAGAMLRDRAADQNGAVQRNFDVWLDQTGAEAPDLRGAGMKVVGALQKDAADMKTQVRAAYKHAEETAGDTPVTLAAVVDHLNQEAPAAATAPILDSARKYALKLGIATEGPDGTLVAQPATLKRAEMFRQAIGRATDYEPTNVRQSSIIKGAIDSDTAPLGGPEYQQARRLRENFANRFENNAVISKLLANKRGTNDRQVAFEDVWRHAIDSGSLDDVRKVRSVLQTAGEDGHQAWRELQGRTLAHLKEAATQNAQMDVRGQPVVSPAGLSRAIKALDQDGKLDFIFGKQGAQKLRDVNDLSQVMFTAPPGSVNTSNTASVVLAALAEAGATGAVTGLPVPVMSVLRIAKNHHDQAKLRARVQEALDGGRVPAATRRNP